MKIGYDSIEWPEGKVKYNDDKLDTLVKKHQPRKISPLYVELIKEDFNQADGIIIPAESLVDILIHDMVKCETRLNNTQDEAEKTLMKKCINQLEEETPLCDVEFNEMEKEHLLGLSPWSYKPLVIAKETDSLNDLIGKALRKAGIIMFYTAGPKEVHAWPVPKGSDIITCAGKIHSDLARGFIKGDVVNYDDYTKCHNFNDCKKKGLAKVVDRDHIVEDGNIIEIRFNV